MTRPLPARLVLLALAAALAASLVFAMIVAEHRDVDGRAKGASVAPNMRVEAPAGEATRSLPIAARER